MVLTKLSTTILLAAGILTGNTFPQPASFTANYVEAIQATDATLQS
jgi:hypothetical protein